MPATLRSLRPIQAILDQALEQGTITLIVDSDRAASAIRHRCYTYRSLDRAQSRQTYSVGDGRYDTSPYDCLSFRLEPGAGTTWRLVITTLGPSQVPGILRILDASGSPLDAGDPLAATDGAEAAEATEPGGK